MQRHCRPVGFARSLYGRSTTHIGPPCYLQDLSTLDSEHGKGVGRALIEAVYDAARRHRAERVHWLAAARDGSHSASTTRHVHPDRRADMASRPRVARGIQIRPFTGFLYPRGHHFDVSVFVAINGVATFLLTGHSPALQRQTSAIHSPHVP
ncbi:GNAT family N-acetyltransferase [Burkholderia cenocepacia]|uniref:GNAT family N-acetyltransferase n=1 Tax=Burkholderia cenocepacia TaxID=95486 RepID=UPI001E457AE4|nr:MULTISPECIES: GNAT family N-acetyltransferase [Burkholderia cepacia complex]MDN7535022.1 GNAT family N-acetyltransferase [Burkholderia orbicola]